MRIDLPRGQWADICDPEDITGEQKKAYQRAVDNAMYPDGDGQVTYVPAPDNPASLMPVEPKAKRLSAEHIHQLRDMVHVGCIAGWSYDLPVSAESFDKIPAMASDAIEAALTKAGHYDVFNSAGPKGTTETDSTSSSTSEENATTLPPE